ncbi:MAG TPA: type II toxin-antitoxin system Phd/YefM family antitoxin [Streptosporangiaceae bacterium]|nr:type II toxin-antitoxin system Phd/YefM family antitoxin [Streptosporangiaceae bacterium]
MKTMSLAAAKTRFSALVDEAVATHERITVTRNGEGDVTGEDEMASLMRERLGKRDD